MISQLSLCRSSKTRRSMSGRTKRVTVAKKVYEEVESDADMEEEEKGIVTKESAPGDAYSPAG